MPADDMLKLAAPDLATEDVDGYRDAFYEIGDMLGIGARAASPKAIWENEMRPALASAIRALAKGASDETV